MTTLLLQLVGPMQSWGVQSHFNRRDTGLEPSKSGVIGLICAALGRDRAEPIHDLAALHMGVRVDREGVLKADYHTAQYLMKAGGKPFVGLKETELSQRFYLADAAFLVGLEGDAGVLSQAHTALLHPHWLLCLGRRAFVPSRPIGLEKGLFADSLLHVLTTNEPLVPEAAGRRVRYVVDADDGESVRPDQPVSFAKGNRQFLDRRVHTFFDDIRYTDAQEA